MIITHMGRIKQNIEVGDQKFWALFDTGTRNSYISSKVANQFQCKEFKNSKPTRLGGETHYIKKYCILECEIKGYEVKGLALVIDEIGSDEEGKTIDVLIGALIMQNWGIIPVPEKEDVDMSHYPKEFVEF